MRTHLSRSSRWSPTRSVFAMIFSAGFTAPLERKKLPWTRRWSLDAIVAMRQSELKMLVCCFDSIGIN